MAITTPPFRTSLLTQNGVPFGTGNGDIQTTRDWWMYWQQLTDRSNANSKLAGEGAHADRPDPGSMPDGAIYIEADRGAIYSNEGGTWQYIAGTMYGTLSPDQRPTDLGAADAGFTFRGTDQPREFIWSGTAWVEVTAVQYGTHANRPNPTTIVEGALYVESDRGGVIYQRETPAGTPLWQYLAGTMWGTLSPDQRPVGLGAQDAGFDFRGTDQQKEYIWNQTAWVDITALVDPTTTKGDLIARGPAAPATRLAVGADGQVLTADSAAALGVKWGTPAGNAQIAYAASGVTLTTTAQNIPGCSLTLAKAGQYLVHGTFFFNLQSGDSGAYLLGSIPGASADALILGTVAAGQSLQATVSQQWIVTAAAGGTVSLQASKTGGSGASSTGATHTSITALWVSP